MKTINVLLASTERRTNNLIQAVVLDVCYDRAAVNCIQTGRVDELQARGAREGFDLVIVSPGHMVAEPSRRSKTVTLEEVAHAIKRIKLWRPVPVIAVAVAPKEQPVMLDAGADGVLGIPFNGDAMREELSRLLELPELESEPEPARGGLTTFFMRGLQLLKNA